MPKKNINTHRSDCPLASSLDFFGDKWSLLIVRDLVYYGKCTFKDFQQSWENMPTNTLAERLKRLENLGIISKEPYQEKPVRYHYQLAEKGMDLLPAIKQIVLWGQKHIDHTIEIVSVVDGVERMSRPVSVDDETASKYLN
ncbi:MAG: transcriptional regulator [Cellvibrionaceae bacterium]|nr:transcriptional regulator [Cellvibrionaceae bacterium]|tara:strand:- start:17883 stop:18305 length:423 start_codon:yes stop_codon:yes gene_type:complete